MTMPEPASIPFDPVPLAERPRDGVPCSSFLLLRLAVIILLAGTVAVTPAAAQPGPVIFSYAEIRGTLGGSDNGVWSRWQRILDEEKTNPAFAGDDTFFNSHDAETWARLSRAASRETDIEKVRMVNAYFNQWPPGKDEQLWGVIEYWATPREFIGKRSGDCEDYAIAKYFALRHFGIPAENMRIMLVARKDGQNKIADALHAVLAVWVMDDWFILDNNVRPKHAITPHSQYKGGLIPLYSVNELGDWLYTRK